MKAKNSQLLKKQPKLKVKIPAADNNPLSRLFRSSKRTITDLEDLVETKDEVALLYKFKRTIMLSLLNGERVRVPGLGVVEILSVNAGNRYKKGVSQFKVVVEPDTALKIKLVGVSS